MTLHFSSEIVDKRELASRPDMGLVLSRNKAHDEDGDLVFRFTGKGFVQRRPKG
jgi:acyl dehydratase